MPTYSRRQALPILCGGMLSRLRAAPPAPSRPLRGIFPILATPYTASNHVDYEDLEREVDFMDRAGAHGMVWPQLASEYRFLSRDERLRGMRVLAKAAKGKRPALVLGIQGAAVKEALGYAELAEELAPDAVIAIPPAEAKGEDDFRAYYQELARIVRRPFFVQTSGGARGIEITAAFLTALARELPHFGYVKEEQSPIPDRIAALSRARPPMKGVFSGPIGLYEMRAGCDGCMPEALYPDIDARIWDLYHSGRQGEARELFARRLLMVNAAQQIPGGRAWVMKRRGVFKTAISRREKAAVSPEAERELEFELEALRPHFKI
jgi:4-hydroxy-tetrahydrodipicolinate synthase